jgi:hypothetical protein
VPEVNLNRLSRDVIDRAMGRIALMKFFPSSDTVARATVMLELIQMCSTDDQVEWLSKRLTVLYTEWPGLRELRAVFCSKFKPADKIEVNSADARFIDGIPSEQPAEEWKPALESGQRLLTGGTEEFSADPELDELIHQLATEKTLPAIQVRTKEEIERDLYQATNRTKRFEARERPPQIISAEEVESARQMEMLRRQTVKSE